MAKSNERKITIILLVFIITCLFSALYIRCTGKLTAIEKKEEKTSLLRDRKNLVEDVSRRFDGRPPVVSDRVAAKLRAAGYSDKIFSTVTTTVGNPTKQP